VEVSSLKLGVMQSRGCADDEGGPSIRAFASLSFDLTCLHHLHWQHVDQNLINIVLLVADHDDDVF
jgi:hypothetical protein